MRWYDDELFDSTVLKIPYNLLRVNDEIYDEIITRSDGYYLLKRCGIEEYNYTHKWNNYITDYNYTIYELPIVEQNEIKLDIDFIPISEDSYLIVNGTNIIPDMSITFNIDRRYEENRIEYDGTDITIEQSDIDSNRNVLLNEIDIVSDCDGTLNIDIDGTLKTITIPTQLETGDKLTYIENNKSWCLIRNGTLKYFNCDSNVLLEGKEIKCDQHIYISVPYIKGRALSVPQNITVVDSAHTGKNGFGYVSWDEVVGATSYKIFLDGILKKEINNEVDKLEQYDFTSETEGTLTISASNDLATSALSDAYQIRTVPNSVSIKSFDSNYENSRYSITLTFDATSKIATQYSVLYNIDNSYDAYKTYSITEDDIGKTYTLSFQTSSIKSNIAVKILSINDTGTNDYEKYTMFYLTNGVDLWTYKTSMKQALVTWLDNFSNESAYDVKYRINKGDWQVQTIDGAKGRNSRLSTYIDLGENDTMDICVSSIVNGLNNIYSQPLTISKQLDKNLVAPKNFIGKKIEDNVLQFSWKDDYSVDDSYELSYSFNGNATNSVKIPSTNKSGTGTQTYDFQCSDYGYVNARLRMVWELGESEYTNYLTVYNVPTVTSAPDILCRENANDLNGNPAIRISWQYFDYVKSYVLTIVKDGKTQTIEQADNEYYFIIDPTKNVCSIEFKVAAKFLDDSMTDVSDTVSFNMVAAEHKLNNITYQEVQVKHDLITTIGRALLDNYILNTLITSTCVVPYDLYTKIFTEYLMKEYKLESNFWGHGLVSEGDLIAYICNKDTYETYMHTVVFYQTLADYLMNEIYYAHNEINYNLHMEVNKTMIVCIGDSITAG